MAATVPVSRFGLVAFVERRGRGFRAVLWVLAALLVVLYAARWVAQVILDRWWFESVTNTDVWSVRFIAQLQLLLGVGLLTAAVLGSTVWLVLRLGRLQREPPSRFMQRYHERMGPAHRWLLVGIAVFFSLRIGFAATDRWQSWVLFREGSDLGVEVPIAGGDLGYHLFKLPFLAAASSFLRQLLLLTLGVALFGHGASGALRLSPKGSSSRVAKAHIAMVVAGLLAVQALHDVVVARASVATNRIGAFDGPGFTERYISKPGLLLAALAAVAAGFAAVWWARTDRWRPFASLLAVAAVIQVAVVSVVPTVVEKFFVAPAEAERQLWSIEYNLDATKLAFEIDDVEAETFRSDSTSDVGVEADVARVQLFGSSVVASALQILSATTGTRITDADLDRYVVDDESVPIYIAARSASRADVPEVGWVQDHLVYTNGNGVVTVPADRTDADGRPDIATYADGFGASDVPLYFGEGLDNWYAIVGTARSQLGGAEFDGEGVALSSFGQRLVLALAVGEYQPVVSSELTPDSELLYHRSVRERVGSLAPFLRLDGDPYPVVDDGRVVWVIDGYTTSSTYPYSQFVNGDNVPATSDLAGRSFNYLRASVKATVDATTGETHLYRTDDGNDPILQTWSDIFPGLLEPADAIPSTLRAHLKYPADQWTIQTGLLGRYHVNDPEDLFNGTDRWAVSAAAANTVGDSSMGPAPSVDEFTELAESFDGFGSVRPFGPGSATNPTSTRNELSALAVADHELDGSIHLVVPPSDLVPPLLSPQVAQSAIDADPEVAQAITLLNANGSKVQFGPMSPVVVQDALVWVRPIIVTGTGTSAAPRLYGVAAVLNGQVAVEPTAVQAVTAVVAASQ